MAQELKRLGITRVRPLADGFNGWRERGYPLQDTLTEVKAAVG